MHLAPPPHNASQCVIRSVIRSVIQSIIQSPTLVTRDFVTRPDATPTRMCSRRLLVTHCDYVTTCLSKLGAQHTVVNI